MIDMILYTITFIIFIVGACGIIYALLKGFGDSKDDEFSGKSEKIAVFIVILIIIGGLLYMIINGFLGFTEDY